MSLTTVTPGLLDRQAQYTGFKNRIINGDMRIDQRNNGAAITAGFFVDRWKMDADFAGLGMNWQRQTATPPAGFTHYVRTTVTTATTPTASQTVLMSQAIEGFNIADLGWGTANARPVTVSFRARSSLSGTFGGAVSAPGNFGYAFTYSISAPNTWETKTITIPGPTTGTWAADNSSGAILRFDLGSGANWRIAPGIWGSATQVVVGATGTVNLSQTLGATLDITGVQFEKGFVATEFDYRPYGTELALCQRYYEKSFDQTVAPVQNVGSINGSLVISGTSTSAQTLIGHTAFAAEKRAAPTLTTFNPFAAGSGWSQAGELNLASNFYGIGTRSIAIRVNGSPTLTNTNLLIHWTASAEL